jgi:Domain of unknown function (DUF4157)
VLGNQDLRFLLEARAIQAKLRVSQPGDADEIEADRAAEQVVATTHAPKIQRKCACSGSGSPCAKCAEDETSTLHRSVASPMLSSSELSLQRAPASEGPATSPEPAGNPPKPSPTPSRTHPLVVEDEAKSLAPGQMRKSAFIALLRADACATADAVLMSVGRTTKSCPYIEKWLAFYEKQSSDHIERAILKYAPETAHARSAHEAIRLVVMRVQRAAMSWAKTGKVTGLPDGIAAQMPGQDSRGAVHNFASSTVGGAALSFIGGVKPEKSHGDTSSEKSPSATVSRKASDGGAAPAHDATQVRSQLGSGRSLDSHLQSKMSSAFGHDFSGVRVHTDSKAASLSSDLNARAFTIGSDVAFASGEYKPGTPIGDALIAHELAHVVQQGGSGQAITSEQENAASAHLEGDADRSAMGAVVSIWTGARSRLAGFARTAAPRLRSGLMLSRCSSKSNLLADYALKFPDAADLIRKSPAALQLVSEAEKAGAEFGGLAEEGPAHMAWPYTTGHKVYIAKGRADKVVSASDFLFELNNAIRQPKFADIEKQAAKGAAGGMTAKDYARKKVEQEVEGMLRLGEVWVEMKKNAPKGEDWSKYDSEFFLSEYQDFKDKRKTKDDIIKDVLQRPSKHDPHPEWTVEQYYMDQFSSVAGGK